MRLPETIEQTLTAEDGGRLKVTMELSDASDHRRAEVVYRVVRAEWELVSYAPEGDDREQECLDPECDAIVWDEDGGYCFNCERDEDGVKRSECECYGGHDILSDPPEICGAHYRAYRQKRRQEALQGWTRPSPESLLD
jgi:hypothetical protein